MEADKKKAVSRRTMRVATTFTGVAVFAVGFAATATADAQGTTARTGHRPLGDHLRRIRPLTLQEGRCSAEYASHFLHVGWHTSIGWGVECFGGVGAENIFGGSVSKYCGGNNIGFIEGTNNARAFESSPFGSATKYTKIRYKQFILSGELISAYSGENKCPEHP